MGKGIWHPPKEINPNPPSGSLPRSHPGQGASKEQPTHAGGNTNLKGFGGKGTGAASRRNDGVFDRYRP